MKIFHLSNGSNCVLLSNLVTFSHFMRMDWPEYTYRRLVVKRYAKGPIITDPNLDVQVIFKNNGKLDVPTTGMAFLGSKDILVLELLLCSR